MPTTETSKPIGRTKLGEKVTSDGVPSRQVAHKLQQ
jgi:hypothetical protein